MKQYRKWSVLLAVTLASATAAAELTDGDCQADIEPGSGGWNGTGGGNSVGPGWADINPDEGNWDGGPISGGTSSVTLPGAADIEPNDGEWGGGGNSVGSGWADINPDEGNWDGGPISGGTSSVTLPGAADIEPDGGKWGGGDPDSGCGQLVLAGPVSAIDRDSGSFEVLGVAIPLAGAPDVAIGDYAQLRLDEAARGTVTTEHGIYVPGSTPVVISGRIAQRNLWLGELHVGGVLVDYTALIGKGGAYLADSVTIVGTQPVPGGKVLATQAF